MAADNDGYDVNYICATLDSDQSVGVDGGNVPTNVRHIQIDELEEFDVRAFIQRLSKKQIRQIVSPIQQGTLSPETLFHIKSTSEGGRIRKVKGQDIIDAIECKAKRSSIFGIFKKKIFNFKCAILILLLLCCLQFIPIAIMSHHISSGKTSTDNLHNDNGNISELEPQTTNTTNAAQQVMILGGLMEPGFVSDSLEVYFPQNQTAVLQNSSMLIATALSIIGHFQDTVLVAGGGVPYANGSVTILSSLQIYNQTTKVFSLGHQMEIPRVYASGAMMDGKLYVCAGLSYQKPVATVKSCEVYEPIEESWHHISDMHISRMLFAMAAHRGYLYVIGGNNEQGMVDTVERYNSASDQWVVTKTRMITPSYLLAATTFGDSIIACGGFNSVAKNDQLSLCQEMNTTSFEWRKHSEMTQPRCLFGLFDVSGTLYAFSGGGGYPKADNSVEYFDQTSKSWKVANPFFMPRYAASFYSK